MKNVEGCHPVARWLALLDDPSSVLYRKLTDLYGARSLIDEPAALLRRTIEEFSTSFGNERRVFVVRSTGRVNLMGMHTDHRGGSVNPIAIKEAFFAVEPREDDLVVLRNVESHEFPEESFSIFDCLPAHKIGNWDTWCHGELEKRKGDPSVTWSNYVRAAVLYLQHLHTKSDGTFDPPFRGMNVMACGNVPRAAGLSTSSCLVVAAAEACVRINGLKMDPMELIEACGTGEWYVGTRGGSGDHAAIKFGRPNSILHMTSKPLSIEVLPFPPGYSIVLANSMVEAKKQAGARNAFNSRVAAYIFGRMLARKNFPRHAPRIEHLRDINPRTLGVDDAEIFRIIRSLPERATREEVLELLSDEEDEVRHIFRSHDEPAEGYRIRQICIFGIAECVRGDVAAERMRVGDIRGFGELMRISQEGDRATVLVNGLRVSTDHSYPDDTMDALIRDASSHDPGRGEHARLWRQPGGYDVSVPETDILVDIANATPGMVGARLIGAGLGGSIAAIMEEAHAEELVKRMAAKYYRPRSLPVKAELIAPVGGAGVIDI